MAFGLGSLFMVLLIIVYWDDIGGGFNLYPLQEHKHESHGSASDPRTTAGPSHFIPSGADRASSSRTLIATAYNKTLGLEVEERHIEVEEEAEDRVTLEQRHEERTGNTEEVEEEERHETFVDEDQEVRKRRITDMCSGVDATDFPGRTRAFEQIPNRELDHLIVDDTHQIIYCFVPKVPSVLLDSFQQTAVAKFRLLFQCFVCWFVFCLTARKRPARSDRNVYGPRVLSFFLPSCGSGCMHQLEESDGGSVSVSDLTLLRETLQ